MFFYKSTLAPFIMDFFIRVFYRKFLGSVVLLPMHHCSHEEPLICA